MAKKRITHVQTFDGGVKTVYARELVPHNVAIKMQNCHVMVTAEGDVGVVRNPKGNLQISFALPEGQNQCIGYAKNPENNVAFLFYWNSNKFHSIRKFNSLTKKVDTVLLNLTDTGNIDILKFDRDKMILHADVTRRDLLYWCDGLNNARKTNVSKLQDKSSAGYGDVVKQEFIDAYKRTSAYAPKGEYFSDLTKPFNKLYGNLLKVAQRFRYDDYEKSVISDFSAVVLPDREPSSGINSIPTNNNGINFTLNTGDRLVHLIEVIVQFASDPTTWFLVGTIDKRELGLSDYSDYIYKFYNDSGSYPAIDPNEVDQNQIYMPKRPLCQALAKRAITYTNGFQGFESVKIDASVTVSYADLFIESGEENKFNDPQFDYTSTSDEDDFVKNANTTRYDGSIFKVPLIGGYRFKRHTLTVGSDVKKDNEFVFGFGNGIKAEQYDFSYKATLTDTAVTVANQIKAKLIATGKIFRKTPDLPDSDIYHNDTDGEGNVTFSYIVMAGNGGYLGGYAHVEPVEYNTLKDTGQSVKNYKMGSTIKLGIEYEDDPDQRKSLTYTSDALIVGIQPINVDGIKATTIRLQINHRPPTWAKYYNVVRTDDLRYSDFTHVLIQNVVQVPTQNTDNYLDLIIGSFFTYKKLHPNSTLTYAFEIGDRISLLKKTSTDTYYDFFETEVISFSDLVLDKVRDNIKINGTTTVTVTSASIDNVGKFIVIDNAEREIIARPTATTYLLDNPIGELTDKKYNYYELVDRRGVLRIRKPASPVVIENGSIVEVYKPAKVINTDKIFKEFQQKYPIINPGTDEAYHGGNPQNQDATNPALIDLTQGTVYVRNREMPVTNVFPDTQVIIEPVEDKSFSDFYISDFNDNGRINYEDNGRGEVHLDSSTWYSNNAIEDTEINGLGFFQNNNREDHNDEYGATMLTKFLWNRIFLFKRFTDAYLPVDARMTQDLLDTALLVASTKFLNPIQYLTSGMGIGNNPESYASNGSHQYYISPHKGKAVRLGGNGAEPISETFDLDNYVFNLIKDVAKNNGKIIGEYDEVINNYIFSIPSYNKKIFLDGFRNFNTKIQVPDTTTFEIVTPPSHGDLVFTSPKIWNYTSDEGYVGGDNFTYRALVNGVWTLPENVCLNVLANLNTQKSWRPINFSCVTQLGFKTGYQAYSNLEEFYITTGIATGVTKPNVISDLDYVAPVYNPITCVPAFGNVEKSAQFRRNNCLDGRLGELKTYTVPEKTYFRGTQIAADAAAQDDVDTKGQAWVNVHGKCGDVTEYSNDLQIGIFTKQCSVLGQFGTTFTYKIDAGIFKSSISKDDANAKAIAAVNSGGQAYANAQPGGCVTKLYYNDQQEQTFTKKSCGDDFVGSTFTYIVKKDIHSGASKDEANHKALQDILDYGQAWTDVQPGGCVQIRFWNTLQSDIFSKICEVGEGEGTTVAYYVYPHTYSGSSLVEANQKALDEIALKGQANAQTYGLCVPELFWNEYQSDTFTKNNCEDEDFEGTDVLVEVPAHTFSAGSVEDANELALDYLASYGQTRANEEGTCVQWRWWNVELSEDFTKDCSGTPGTVGTVVTYTVPAHTYSGPSQEDADAEAQAEIDDLGQANANSLGECIPAEFGNDARSMDFTKTCESGTGTLFTFTVSADTYYASTKPDANALADGYLTANGQNWADTDPRGICADVSTQPCNETYRFNGGMPSTVVYVATGGTIGDNVDISFDTFIVPDKVLIFDGATQIYNSGYRGDSSYQSALDARLIMLGYPTETIVGGSTGSATITKVGTSPYVRIEYYMPLDGSEAEIYVGCAYTPMAVYDFRWVATGAYCVQSSGNNTGYQAWTTLSKVVDGGIYDGEPLDVNNNRTSESGLAQQTKANGSGDPDYVAPVLNTDACPLPCTLDISIVSTPLSAYGADDGSVDITATGAVGTIQFSKNGGSSWVTSTSPYTFTGLAKGEYDIRVKDTICEVQEDVVVCGLFATIETTNETGTGLDDGTLKVFVTGALSGDIYRMDLYQGVTLITFQIDSTVGGTLFNDLVPADYMVRISDELGCTLDIDFTIAPFSEDYFLVVGDGEFAAMTFGTEGDESCGMTLGDDEATGTTTGLFTDNPDGIINLGDTMYYFDSIYKPWDGDTITVSYIEGGTRVWIVVDSSGEVIDKGTCGGGGCDLEIAFVSKVDESSIGAEDGSITITGSTSSPDGFLLSKNGGASYPFTGASPYTFTGLAAGSYNIKAIDGDGFCEASLEAPVVISVGSSGLYLVTDTPFISIATVNPSLACGAVAETQTFAVYSTNVSGDPSIGERLYYYFYSTMEFVPFSTASTVSCIVGGAHVYFVTNSSGYVSSKGNC